MRQLKITMDGQVAVLAVAEKGSFEAAGKYLGIGKSAVHKRVHSVEQEAGTALFRVSGNRIVPTEAGGLFLLTARESVRQAWLGLDRIQALVRAQANDLRVGYSTYLNTKLLDLVRRLRLEGDGSPSITTQSLMTNQIIESILRGELHIGFGILPISEPDLSTHLLFEEPLMVCLPIGHRLAARSSIQPEDLADESMISVMQRALPGRHEDIVRHFESLGISLKFTSEAFSLKEALWLVTQQMGVTLMTKFSATSHRYEVVIRPLSDRLLTVKTGVFTHRDHSQKNINAFVDLVFAETHALRAKAI